MSYTKNSMLRYINKPPKVLFWNIDEAMSFFLPFVLCALLQKTLWGLVLGIIFFQVFKFIKQQTSSLIAHAFYWYLPTPKGRFRINIPSYIREYIG
jgi:type IV conjugative transfer system protein TraL